MAAGGEGEVTHGEGRGEGGGRPSGRTIARQLRGNFRKGDYIAHTDIRTVQGTITGEAVAGRGRSRIPVWLVRMPNGERGAIPKADARALGVR